MTMTASDNFKKHLEMGNLNEALRAAVSEAVQLTITTWVVPDQSDQSDPSESLDNTTQDRPEKSQSGYRLCTRFNLIGGTVDNEIGSQFLTRGPYTELQDLHLQQVKSGPAILLNNLKSLQKLAELWAIAHQSSPTPTSKNSSLSPRLPSVHPLSPSGDVLPPPLSPTPTDLSRQVPDTPPKILTPEISAPEIFKTETSTPEISTPEISTPEISTPEISTPEGLTEGHPIEPDFSLSQGLKSPPTGFSGTSPVPFPGEEQSPDMGGRSPKLPSLPPLGIKAQDSSRVDLVDLTDLFSSASPSPIPPPPSTVEPFGGKESAPSDPLATPKGSEAREAREAPRDPFAALFGDLPVKSATPESDAQRQRLTEVFVEGGNDDDPFADFIPADPVPPPQLDQPL